MSMISRIKSQDLLSAYRPLAAALQKAVSDGQWRDAEISQFLDWQEM